MEDAHRIHSLLAQCEAELLKAYMHRHTPEHVAHLLLQCAETLRPKDA